MIFYHATPRDNLNSILREGLAFEHGCDPVHLADDGQWAAELVAMIRDIDPVEVVVFMVDVSGLPIDEGWDGPGTYLVGHAISADRLTLLGSA